MKALYRKQYGGPEVLSIKELDKPTPRPKEILIRVKATTINRTDCGLLTGRPLIIRAFSGLGKPKHKITGTDFAGVIEEIGSEVSNFKIGDRVFGLNDEGLKSHAEYMVINANDAIAIIPDEFSFKQAAASAEGAHYAYNFINKIKITNKTKVMLNGATGAIGSAALQMLKDKGVYIAAVANTKNMDLISSFKVDKLYNYEKEDFTNDNEKYDFVFDAVGKSSFKKCKKLLKEKGVYISTELGEGNENVYLPLLTAFGSKQRVIFPFPSNQKRSILYMQGLIAKGAFKPLIDTNYKMEEIVNAYHYVMSGQKTGNVILDLD